MFFHYLCIISFAVSAITITVPGFFAGAYYFTGNPSQDLGNPSASNPEAIVDDTADPAGNSADNLEGINPAAIVDLLADDAPAGNSARINPADIVDLEADNAVDPAGNLADSFEGNNWEDTSEGVIEEIIWQTQNSTFLKNVTLTMFTGLLKIVGILRVGCCGHTHW